MNTRQKPIPDLDNLPELKRDQLHEWIDTLGYVKTIARLKAEWDFTITYNKLRRYWLRWLDKSDYEQVLEDELTIPKYLDLLNGRLLPYDKSGIQRIMMRAYHLVGETGHSATKLATLLRILHYNTNCEWTNKRLEISNRLAAVREQELALKKSRSQPSTHISQLEDSLGPIARSLDDLEARATRKFNLPPLTESKKRAPVQPNESLSLTPDFQSGADVPQDLPTASADCILEPSPSTQRAAPEQRCQMKNAQCSMFNEKPASALAETGTKTPHISETLEHRVNKYTLARYHEALLGKDSTKVGRSAAFNFRSEIEHCPCGQHLPCPDHGDFPPRFFEVSPDDADYFHRLQEKKLPFTSIHELLRRETDQSASTREAPDLKMSDEKCSMLNVQ